MVCCVYLAGATHNPNLYNKAVFHLFPGAGPKKTWYNKYRLFNKREVKMAEETEWRSINTHKKSERGICPAILTEQATCRSIEDLLYGKRTLFSCGTQRVVPSGQDSCLPIAHSGSQSQCRI